jgi:CRISPR-associated endonuclease Csn1
MNGENYMYLLYKGIIDKKEVVEFDLINLKTFVENKHLFNVPLVEIPHKEVYNTLGKIRGTIPCISKLKVGQKVIFYQENIEELKALEFKELKNRIYKIRQLENDGRIKFDYHLEARKEDEIKKEVGDGKTTINYQIPFSKLRLSKSNLQFALEDTDFKISSDGKINWLLKS